MLKAYSFIHAFIYAFILSGLVGDGTPGAFGNGGRVFGESSDLARGRNASTDGDLHAFCV